MKTELFCPRWNSLEAFFFLSSSSSGHSGFAANWNVLICVLLSEASGVITPVHLAARKNTTGQRRHIVTQCLTVAADPASLLDLLPVLIKSLTDKQRERRVVGGGGGGGEFKWFE